MRVTHLQIKSKAGRPRASSCVPSIKNTEQNRPLLSDVSIDIQQLGFQLGFTPRILSCAILAFAERRRALELFHEFGAGLLRAAA